MCDKKCFLSTKISIYISVMLSSGLDFVPPNTRRKVNCQSEFQVILGFRTTEPSMEVLQLDRKSTSRLSCLTIPPTAMELTSRIAESSATFPPSRFSTSDVSDEVIIFFRDSRTTRQVITYACTTHLRPAPRNICAQILREQGGR